VIARQLQSLATVLLPTPSLLHWVTDACSCPISHESSINSMFVMDLGLATAPFTTGPVCCS
jgi:hypothetical protein